MSSYILRASAIVIFASLSFVQIALAVQLEWDQTEVKIELNPNEQEAKAEFTVTNKGKETVEIDRIKTSCGCTGSVLNQKSIQPGESTTIIGTFKKGNRSGLNHNRLQVFLEGQEGPVETLHMIVLIPNLIDARPSIAYWSRNSSKTERQIEITLDKRYITEISSLEYNSKLLTITEKESHDANVDRILIILPKSFDEQLIQTLLIEAKGENGLTAEKRIQVFVQP